MTATSSEEINSVHGMVRVVLRVCIPPLPPSPVSPLSCASPAPVGLLLSFSSISFIPGAGVVGHASTTVVVIGTLGSGMSLHPQCSIVIVVVRHVSVRVGHRTGWRRQIVVYVVEMTVGERVSDAEEEDA